MMILILEDDPTRIELFEEYLPGHETWVTDRPSKAVDWLTREEFDLVMLDHDLAQDHYESWRESTPVQYLTGTGQDVARFIATMDNPPEAAIVHSWNPEGRKAITRILSEVDPIKYLIDQPFGPSIVDAVNLVESCFKND